MNQTPPAKRQRESLPGTRSGPPIKRSRLSSSAPDSCIMLLVFLVSSLLLTGLVAYVLRLDWSPIMAARSTGGAGAVFSEVKAQAGLLYGRDVQDLRSYSLAAKLAAGNLYQAAFKSGAAATQVGLDSIKGWSLVASTAPALQRWLSPANACQPAAKGLNVPEASLRAAFADEEIDGVPVLARLATALGDGQRRKAIAHVVATQAATDDSNLLRAPHLLSKKLGCLDGLGDSCKMLDARELDGSAPELHRLLVEQLRRQPDTLFVVANHEHFSVDQIGVLLQLLGEDGRLNHPDCDVRTTGAAVFVLQPQVDPSVDQLDALVDGINAKGEVNGEMMTGEALRRRFSPVALKLRTEDPAS